jgi:hypothetical protein
MANWLKNHKNFERKRMIKEGRFHELKEIDAEDIKELQALDNLVLEADNYCNVAYNDIEVVDEDHIIDVSLKSERFDDEYYLE